MNDHRGFVAAGTSLADAARAAFGSFALPLAVLAAATLLIGYTPELPEPLAPLRFYGPYMTLGAGLLLSLAFKRGRTLFAILSLLLADAGFRLFLADGPQGFEARTVYAALCVFVPLNLALMAAARERGALNVYGARRLALLGLELGVTAAAVRGGYDWVTDALQRPLLALPPLSPIPQLGLIAMALALVVALACAVHRAGVTEAAFGIALVAFAGSCHAVGSPETYAWLTAAGLVLTAGVLQDSYRMAFRDELTGLPGRRALNERLMGLDSRYTIAMLDIDHFKRFNDDWGHEVGDQALKLVASRLLRVGGGGTAYRYGGEEFAIVFAGTRLPGTLPHVEALREDIERYEFEIRSRQRRRRRAAERAAPPKPGASRWLSVTVSIGVAERNDRLSAPAAVMIAADQALYRAKQAGRNRVYH
jgi:diguanylate cyclase (GGDEF)-like protein